MTEKAIALQLADAIWPWPGISSLTDGQARKLSQAAAELRRLHAELHMNKRASEVWEEKTAWVQDTALPRELGMHRADVLKDRIDRLTRTKAELLAALQRLAGYDLPDEAAIVVVVPAEALDLILEAAEVLDKVRVSCDAWEKYGLRDFLPDELTGTAGMLRDGSALTHPPPLEWQGLSEEELEKLMRDILRLLNVGGMP
jgi:hypothetical protein